MERGPVMLSISVLVPTTLLIVDGMMGHLPFPSRGGIAKKKEKEKERWRKNMEE